MGLIRKRRRGTEGRGRAARTRALFDENVGLPTVIPLQLLPRRWTL